MDYIDRTPIAVQRAASALSRIIPYPTARGLWLRFSRPADPHEQYLQEMRLEVLWLGARYLRKRFLHSGVEHIDPAETYVITSLHFGQWGMYPASLNVQYGIPSQMIGSGRNMDRSTRQGHFWFTYGHRRQGLSGHPICYSTDSMYRHLERLRAGTSLVAVADVRERLLFAREARVEFLGGPFHLQRAVPLMARRAKVRILPYLGFYDAASGKHRVQWFEPISPGRSEKETLQRVATLFEPIFASRPHMYFNDLARQRRPRKLPPGSTGRAPANPHISPGEPV
jgi:lauroyl/myristoyl acyltransferase